MEKKERRTTLLLDFLRPARPGPMRSSVAVKGGNSGPVASEFLFSIVLHSYLLMIKLVITVIHSSIIVLVFYCIQDAIDGKVAEQPAPFTCSHNLCALNGPFSAPM